MKKAYKILITLGFVLVILVLIFLLIKSSRRHREKYPLTAYVNPFIGTDGHGHTFPGATLPFGMVQLSPDTRLTGWDGCSGYHFTDTIIYGFSHTHLSGTGISDYGDILIMPTIGGFRLKSGYIDQNHKTTNGYGSNFDKISEIAHPGYYSVFLKKYQIKAELTATKHCGFHRYIYPRFKQNTNIILDLKHRDKVLSSALYVVNDTEIAGYRISSGWARQQYIYFYAKFSKPIKKYLVALNDSIIGSPKSVTGQNIKAIFYFDNYYNNDTLLIKVGLSAVDTAGAHKNLIAELPDWDFDKTVKKADSVWNSELSKIQIKADSLTKVKFYTALYHTLIAPNIYQDVDGRYRGTDLKIHQDTTFKYYTVFSLWDTYRATHPLYTIIEQHRDVDFIKTFLKQYQYGGKLPMWELAGNYTYTMIGYHAVPVIADAYLKRLKGFDTSMANKALKAMVETANGNRFGLKAYRRFGYIPRNFASASVSRTLEYAFDDWCIAQMALKMQKPQIFKTFIQRAQYWKNVFDPQTKFMRGKIDAMWVSPFDPYQVNQDYTEANAWQYSFYVPQDIATLIKFFGGKQAFDQRLDSLFNADTTLHGLQQPDITGMIGQYAHGNEPSHHLAYMYVFGGQPYKSQKLVRQIMRKFYTTLPNGLIGNEDCGQLSAWYIFSALGFYPVTPCSNRYILGSPEVKQAVIRLENGRKFRIKVLNFGKNNIYVKSVRLNGRLLNTLQIRHRDIVKGGSLVFEMTDKPTNYGSIFPPKTLIYQYLITPAPFAYPTALSFKDMTNVRLGDVDPMAKIYYALDDTTQGFRLYKKPLVIDRTTTVYFYAKAPNKIRSKLQFVRLIKNPSNYRITLKTKYSPRYSAGGDNALIDGIVGGLDFRLGGWQGYEGQNLDAIVDLGKVQTVKSVAIRFLQDTKSWIFMPLQVKFYYSVDGKNFKQFADLKNTVDPHETLPVIKVFEVKKPIRARYIRIFAQNRGTCPSWHIGAGGKCWIFADEIFIK